jgi:ribose transport system substrate-binding protein
MSLVTADGRGDPAVQTSQVEDMVAQGVDVLVLSPVDSEGLVAAVEAADAAGTKVITADRTVDDAPILSYIGADNVEAGVAAGEFISEQLDGEGRLLEIQGIPGASPTIDRGNGLRQALEGTQIEIIDSQNGEYARAEGLQVMEDFLQKYGPGEIDAVFAHNDEMILGAVQAIAEAGRQDEGIITVGVDGQESAIAAIKAGDHSASVVYPIPVPEAILAAAKACVGEELPTRIKQSSQVVTQENVDDFEGTVGF